MCCRLERVNNYCHDVYYQNKKVGGIELWTHEHRIRFGMGSAGLAPCEIDFVRDWMLDQVKILNLTRRLTA